MWEDAGGQRAVYEEMKLERTREGYKRQEKAIEATKKSSKLSALVAKTFSLDYSEKEDKESQEEKAPPESFETLGVSAHLLKGLRKMGIVEPTPIQCKAIPPMLDGRDVIIQSMTGTGKSLAFLLPILQSTKHLCSTLIIVPTRELAVQLLMVANKLVPSGPRGPFSVALVAGVENQVTVGDLRHYVPRIIIATPKRLLQVIAADPDLFSGVRRIVLDEVDRMIPPLSPHATIPELKRRELHPRPALVILKLLRREILPKTSQVQLICASATLNKWMRAELLTMGFSSTAKLALMQERWTMPKGITHKFAVYRSLTMPKARLLVQVSTEAVERCVLLIGHQCQH